MARRIKADPQEVERYTVKAQVIVDYENCNILSVDFSSGRKHDFALFKATRNIIAESTLILADKGYQGIIELHENSLTPIKKYKGKKLSSAEKWYNQIVSKSRALIERINRRLKVFRILSGRFRNNLCKFENIFSLVCAIFNFSHFI